MMRLFKRLLCFTGFHEVPAGVDPDRSIVWVCRSCGALVPGAFAERRRR